MSEPRRPEDDQETTSSYQPPSSTPSGPTPASATPSAAADNSSDVPESAFTTTASSADRYSATEPPTYGGSSSSAAETPPLGAPSAPTYDTPPSYQTPPASYGAPTLPPAYGQPGSPQQPGYPQQPAAWGQPASGQQYWAPVPTTTEYGSSILVILAGVWLVISGLFLTLIGVVMVLAGNAMSNIDFEGQGIPLDRDTFSSAITIFAVVVLVLGVLHLLSAIFMWAHRSWARYVGMILAVLGSLLGVLMVMGSLQAPRSITVDGVTQSTQSSIVVAGIVLGLYLFTLLALIVGGKHFERRPVR